jgi:ABC-type uncharacterized transport system involved in gliding motility auxiliary subunit
MSTRESFAYSAVGLISLFLILVLGNYLASGLSARLDLTQGELYTLSPGTKKALKDLDAPLEVKLYISQGEDMPVQMRGFAARVQDMLREFQSVAGSKLKIERYDPAPDTDTEDAAQLDGVDPRQLSSGEQFYLGVVVSRLDRKQVVNPSPQREQLLEYDLARAIARVGAAHQPVIGLMTSLPYPGGMTPPGPSGATPRVFIQELKQEFDVKPIAMNATAIPQDINVLLVIHPREIAPATEYALDQFVLRGGKLIAFVDPYAYFDRTQAQTMPGMPASSSLPILFKAWGVTMEPNKVVADIGYASGRGERYSPTVLALNRSAFDTADVVTNQLQSLLYAFGGAFQVKPASGLKVTDLIHSSPESMLVDNISAIQSGEAATRAFHPTGKSQLLAVRLTGKFKTAFPDGPPGKAQPSTAQIKESAGDSAVVLVGDSDMLADGAAVDVQNVFGQQVVVPINDNLALGEGLVEQMAGGDDLASLRARAVAFRPLVKVRQMEADAEKQYLGKINELQQNLQQTTERLQALQQTQGPDVKSAKILSAEQQAEIARFRKSEAATKLELRDLRRQLRLEADRLVFLTKMANIALMPVLVALFGIGVALTRRRRMRRACAIQGQARA